MRKTLPTTNSVGRGWEGGRERERERAKWSGRGVIPGGADKQRSEREGMKWNEQNGNRERGGPKQQPKQTAKRKTKKFFFTQHTKQRREEGGEQQKRQSLKSQ